MITNCKNILVLAPHTDDGELGLGGTISRLIEDMWLSPPHSNRFPRVFRKIS